MNTEEFLGRVLPQGVHFIMYPTDRINEQTGKPFMGHIPFHDLVNGVRKAKDCSERKRDVWFSVAGFASEKLPNPRDPTKTVTGRQSHNATGLKCLFLDIDFKDYPSEKDAIQDLGRFLQETGIEKPTILVHSGNGLHVYWTFANEIDPKEWDELASGLAGLCENKKLRVDAKVTIDRARVLRLPGTNNYKNAEPKPCRVLSSRPEDADLDKLRASLKGIRALPKTRKVIPFVPDPEVVAMFSVADDLGRNTSIPKFMERIAAGCPLLGDMLARGGNGDHRDLWNNMLLLAAYTEDGRAYAHKLSQGDPRYSAEQVDYEFDQKVADRDRLGPTTCSAFARLSPHCAACPHRSKITSPIQLGVEQKAKEVATLVNLPTGKDKKYFITRNGATYVMAMVDGVEELIPVFDAEIIGIPFLSNDGHVVTEIKFRTGEVRRLDIKSIYDKKMVTEALAAIHLMVDRVDFFTRAMMAWVKELRSNSVLPDYAFGWQTNGEKGFALAGNFYSASGVSRVGSRQPVVDHYVARGDEGAWNAIAAKLVADPRTEIQIILATAFAAPLLKFSEIQVSTVVARSTKSGVGKSVAMKTARAVWGDPIDMLQACDTAVAVEGTVGELMDMPWYWDEMHTSNLDQFSSTVYQIMQGRLKSRGNRDATVRVGRRARGMLVMATNTSVKGLMREANQETDAGEMRVLELDVRDHPRGSKADSEFKRMVARLGDNNGHAGVKYVQYMVANYDKVMQLIDKVAAVVDKQFESLREERFRIAAVNSILVGAILAKDAGICDFDVPRIMQHLKDVLRTERAVVQNNDDLLTRICGFLWERTYITDHYTYKKGGKPKVVHTNRHPVEGRGMPALRIASKDKIMGIATYGIDDFARANKMLATTVREYVRQLCKDPPYQTTIDKGIGTGPSTCRRTMVYILDYDPSEVEDHLDASPDSSSETEPSGSTAS